VVLIALLVMTTLGLWLVSRIWVRQWRGLAVTAAGAVVGGITGLGLILWSNPVARIAPVRWLIDSIVVASQYPWIGPIRVNGVDVNSNELPWTYVPDWLLAQLPLLTTAVVAAGLILTVWMLIKPAAPSMREDLAAALPIYVQGLALPLTIILAGSILYDGIRHLLFGIPALIAIGAVGIWSMAKMTKPSARVSRAVPYVVAFVVVAFSFFACVRWYPYQYAFVNPVAGWDKEHRNWEIDYWGLSGREGVAKLKELGAPVVLVLPNGDSSSLFGGLRSTELVAQWPKGAWQYGIYTYQRWENYLPGNCKELVRIERDGILIGNGGLCPPPVEVIASQGG
jgi:hypothetical protein